MVREHHGAVRFLVERVGGNGLVGDHEGLPELTDASARPPRRHPRPPQEPIELTPQVLDPVGLAGLLLERLPAAEQLECMRCGRRGERRLAAVDPPLSLLDQALHVVDVESATGRDHQAVAGSASLHGLTTKRPAKAGRQRGDVLDRLHRRRRRPQRVDDRAHRDVTTARWQPGA